LIRAALAALAVCIAGCSRQEADEADQWRAVAIEATAIDFGAPRAGRLVYRGGVALSAADRAFGGVSGIEVLEGQRLVAVTDSGVWLQARLVLDDAGALIGIADARMADMRDEAGAPFPTKRAGDAEAITQIADGRFAVAFERTQSIRFYDLNRDGPFGAAEPGPVLAGARARLPANAGIEALAASGDVLIAGAEGCEGPTQIWRAALGQSDAAPIATRFPLGDGYSLAGLDRLPDGGFVALERFYAPVIGGRVRLSWFPDGALDTPLIEPQLLAEWGPPLTVDNFESVSAVRAPDGGTRIYVMSDDNHSRRQRTLLLAFDVAAPKGD